MNSLFLDTSNNLYTNINDGYSDKYGIRKISKIGLLTSYVDFYYRSSGLACDNIGNLYVSNIYSIFKVVDNGVYQKLADLDYPLSLATDTSGNLFAIISDRSIIKIDKNGKQSTYVGSGIVSQNWVFLACDNNGNLYVGDSFTNLVKKITKNGKISTFVSSGLSQPYGMVCDASGNLYIANYGNNTISKVDPSGNVSIFAAAGLNSPYGLAIDKYSNLYVTNAGNNTIIKYDSSGNVSFYVTAGLANISSIAIDTLGNLYISNYINSGFCVSKISNDALPVTLSSFTATANNNATLTKWNTSTELNTNYFTIQRSRTTGTSFTDIGKVKAIGSGANSYEFTDNNPANGINYYRLLSIDKDGSSTFSKVVSVNCGDKQSFSIIPNPGKDFATISFSKSVDKATVAVYDITGKQVITQSLSGNANSYKLNTQSLKNGLYVIKVNTATGNYNEKLFINK